MDSMLLARIVGAFINVLALFSKHYAGRLAFQLFCTPRSGRELSEKDKRFLNTAQKDRIPFDNYELQCYCWKGAGKTVYLAHGFQSNTSRWRALVGLLNRAGYTVVAMDAPAHGLSGGSTINGVLYARAVKTFLEQYPADIVLGHSLGGMALVYYFSHLNGQAVEKMILMAVPSELSTIMDLYMDALRLSQRARQSLSSYFRQYLHFDIEYFSVSHFIQDVSLPGLLIADEDDPVALFEEAQAISNSWSDSELLATNGLGHSLQGRKVFRAILDEVVD